MNRIRSPKPRGSSHPAGISIQPKKPGRGRPEKYAPEDMLLVIQAARGLVATAARLAGCTRDTVAAYLTRYPHLRVALEAERERFLDEAEHGLRDAVQRGEAWAICFTLKTLGKARGYVERQAYASGPAAGPVHAPVTIYLPDNRRPVRAVRNPA